MVKSEREPFLFNNLTGIYFQEAGEVSLLTREEEGELARRYIRAREAKVELETDGLKPEKRKELESLIVQGEEAKKKFVEANLFLVISIAKGYYSPGMSSLDLIQEGNIGLMRAVDKFDPERGNRFSTYATWWIRQAISRALEKGPTIRIPIHAREDFFRLQRVNLELTGKLGREPTLEELAEESGWPEEKVEKIQNIPKIALSLDMPTGVEEDSYLGEFIEDPDATPPIEVAERMSWREEVSKIANAVLTEREKKILELRYGGGYTLDMIAQEFGVTRERIRQIQGEALEKLRQRLTLEKIEV